MSDSTHEGTNAARIEAELERASREIAERSEGYRDLLVAAAMECISDSALHEEARTNINQRFDAKIQEIVEQTGGHESTE